MGEIVIYNDKARERLELARIPAVIDVLDIAEKRIYKAQFQRPMSDYSQEELAGEFRRLIPRIANDIGCRMSDGDVANIVRMAETIRAYFGMLTLKDFCTAFELSAMGELDRFLPKRDGNADRGHYGMFSLEYVAKILKAYRLRRAETMRKAEDARPKASTTDTEAENKKADRVAKDMFYLDYLYYKYHERMPVISPAAVIIYAKILARLGWIDAQFSEVFPSEQAGAIAAMTDTLARRVPRAHEWTERKRREIERAFRDMVEDEIQFDKFI